MDDRPIHTPSRAAFRVRVFALTLLAATTDAGCYQEPPPSEIGGGSDDGSDGTQGTTPSDSAPGDDDGTTPGGPDASSADGTDTNPGADTSDGPDDGCGAGATCLAIPDGWNGPVAAIDALGNAATPACEGAFTSASFTAFDGLDAPAAECGCDCIEPADVSCPATASLNRYDDNQTNCVLQMPDDVLAISAGCNDIPFYEDDSFRLVVPPLDLAATPCTPQPSSALPPVAWATQVAGCGLEAAPAACDGGSCVPEPGNASQRLCVWTEGDVACSGDVFTDKQVLHRDVEDTRACSECSCAPAEGSCGATFTLRAGEGCTVGSPGSGPADVCVPIATPARSVELAWDAPDISCPASGGEPQGAAAPSDAITLCCAAQ